MSTVADAIKGESPVIESEAESPADRRRHERLGVYLRVRWEGLLGCHEGTVSDVSAGGCFILTESPAGLRELVRLEIELHTGEWVKVWGEVTNQFAGVGFGVKYTEFEEEDGRKFTLSLEHTKSIRQSAAALKTIDGSFQKVEGGAHYAPRVDRQEYKALLARALPAVNKTLLDLPECRKKSALRMSIQAYADAHRVWSAMSEAAAGAQKNLPEAYKCLREKYGAPPEVLEAMLRGDLPPVLTFLRQKARIYFTFVS